MEPVYRLDINSQTNLSFLFLTGSFYADNFLGLTEDDILSLNNFVDISLNSLFTILDIPGELFIVDGIPGDLQTRTEAKVEFIQEVYIGQMKAISDYLDQINNTELEPIFNEIEYQNNTGTYSISSRLSNMTSDIQITGINPHFLNRVSEAEYYLLEYYFWKLSLVMMKFINLKPEDISRYFEGEWSKSSLIDHISKGFIEHVSEYTDDIFDRLPDVEPTIEASIN